VPAKHILEVLPIDNSAHNFLSILGKGAAPLCREEFSKPIKTIK